MERLGKKAPLIWLLLALSALVGRVAWDLLLASGSEAPEAEQGVLDLRQWDFAAAGGVPLNGQWTFYPGRLLAPEALADGGPRDGGIEVRLPGDWDRYVSGGAPTPFGYGTYHLVIRTSGRETGVFGIRTSLLRSANKLYVDGRQVGASGNPAAGRSLNAAGNTPYLALFPLAGDRVDVVLQVANFDYAVNGGILLPLRFGPADKLLADRQWDDLADSSLGGMLLVFAVYFLFMYGRRRSYRELLYFAAYCLFFALYILTHGEKLLLHWLPALPFEWATKLQIISFVFCAYMYYLFAKTMNPGLERRIAAPIIHAAAGAALLTVLLTEARFYSRLETPLAVLACLITAWAVYLLFLGARSGKTDAIWEMSGCVGLVYYFLSSSTPYTGIPISEKLPAVTVAAYVLLLAVLVSRRFERALDKAESLSRKLSAADRAKDEFLADAARELKTPLNTMLQLVQSSLEEQEDAGETRQPGPLQLALSAGERLRFLLDELSEVSLLEEGKLALNIRRIKPRAAIERAIEAMRSLIDPLSIRVDNRVGPDVPDVAADSDRLMRMLLNLLYNAAHQIRRGTLVFEAARAGLSLEIRVFSEGRETGPPFAEPDSALRLYLFRRLAELQGGSVPPLPGPEFAVAFTVPLASAAERPPIRETAAARTSFLAPHEAAAAAEEERTPPPGPGAGRILLAGAEPLHVRALQHLLHAESYRTHAVSSGSDALAALREDRDWDLIILDIALPDRSGFDICRELRKTYSATALPVLMLTSRHRRTDLLAGFSVGATDFAALPVDAEEFKARVRTLIGLKRSTQMRLHAEMAFLQAQIKPHFLFNTINTILAVSNQDVRRAQQLLIDLGTYLRNSFAFHNLEDEIPLQHELELIEAYLKIERARFGNRLETRFDVRGDRSMKIPPLVVQPIVENAVRHGATKRPEGGWVKLELRPDEGGCTIIVSDNGPGFNPSQTFAEADGGGSAAGRGQGVGLANIAGRLRALGFDPPQIDSQPGRGTSVTVHLGKRRKPLAEAHSDR